MKGQISVSIITVVLNAEKTIADTIRSVASQTYPFIEHIVIDGGSTDGTQKIILSHKHHIARFISEPDMGMYDAMNKGYRFATGDLIGYLHSDDVYADNEVITCVVENFQIHKVDAIYGDLVYVSPDDLQHVVRYYDSKPFNPDMIAKGYMPAHPTLFFKESVYRKYGLFKTDYKIAADFEYVARVFGNEPISYYYMPKVMVKMRTGGKSTRSFMSNWILNKEIRRACRENGIRTNYCKIYSKYSRKLFGLIRRKDHTNK
jgi:glycosyltransferase involved in cell wall biosynthesis